MKKTMLILLTFLIITCLSGCGANAPEAYLQSNLPKPDYIELNQNNTTVSYEKDSEKYNEIYEAILQNWWKTSVDESSIIDDNDLVEVENIKQIKTTSDMRYSSSDDTFLRFYYEEQPFIWTKSAKETTEIGNITFVLPEYPEENKCVKSHYIAYRADNFAVNEGIYTYYFNNDVFEALSENAFTVSTIYNESPVEIDLQYFSDLTVEEMKEKLITYNNWTHLKDHHLYWNPLTEQLIINHMFSSNVSEKELESAKHFWKTMHFVNRDASVWTMHLDVWNMYNNITKDAETIIQVYVEDELVSQSIYSDIENNLIYKVMRYEKN